MRILIADDDPVSRTVLAKILQAHPEHVTTVADDGAAAWALLDDPARSFDVLFLDLSMPRLDGFELLKKIRGNPFLKSLEIVVCTGSADRATVIKAAQLGARHYLVKPCTEPVVLAKLRQLQPA
jgi:CheY-like chemotaxis protein